MASRNVETFRTAHDNFNRRELDAVISSFRDDFEYTDRARGRTYTKQEFKDQFMAGWITAFSDAAVTDREYLDAGNVVVCRFTGRGRNDGPMENMPASGRQMAIPFCEIFRFDADGKAASGEALYDQLSILTQLGLMPAEATA